jgi:hypothetical protein
MPFGRNISLNVLRVDAVARLDNARLHVCPEKLNGNLGSFVAEKFKKRHRHRICLLSGSAPGSPDSNAPLSRETFLDGGEYRGFQASNTRELRKKLVTLINMSWYSALISAGLV